MLMFLGKNKGQNNFLFSIPAVLLKLLKQSTFHRVNKLFLLIFWIIKTNNFNLFSNNTWKHSFNHSNFNHY